MSQARRLLSELERTSARLTAAVDQRLRREADLPLALFEPMSVIAGHDALRVHELSAELGMSSGGVSKLLDRLEARGLCQRQPNPGDRRSSLLRLTPAGQALLARAGQLVDAELSERLGPRLSAAEIAQLAGLLERLRRALAGD
jgi:MarR family transcriptional regulator, organic hydroperoxide resistance regulator